MKPQRFRKCNQNLKILLFLFSLFGLHAFDFGLFSDVRQRCYNIFDHLFLFLRVKQGLEKWHFQSMKIAHFGAFPTVSAAITLARLLTLSFSKGWISSLFVLKSINSPYHLESRLDLSLDFFLVLVFFLAFGFFCLSPSGSSVSAS